MSLTWNRSVDWSSKDWREASACRDLDPGIFFPIGGSGFAVDQIEEAKTVCNTA